MADDPIMTEAKRLYEESRQRVSGRPAWEDLDPQDPYDMGMRQHAYDLAKSEADTTPPLGAGITTGGKAGI